MYADECAKVRADECAGNVPGAHQERAGERTGERTSSIIRVMAKEKCCILQSPDRQSVLSCPAPHRTAPHRRVRILAPYCLSDPLSAVADVAD